MGEHLLPRVDERILDRTRRLRGNQTDAETKLWRELRKKALRGYRFRRQHPIDRFIVDFYCHEAKLAVELDGGGHAGDDQARYDAYRTRTLEGEGVRVLRFWDHDVLTNLEAVLERIRQALFPHPDPPPEGEG